MPTDTPLDFAVSDAATFDDSAARAFLDDGFCRVDNAIEDDDLARLRSIYDWCFSSEADGKIKRKALGGVDEQGRHRCSARRRRFPNSEACPTANACKPLRERSSSKMSNCAPNT